MKVATALLVAGFLLATAPVFAAADDPTPTAQAPSAEAPSAEGAPAPSAPPFEALEEEPLSTPNCPGADLITTLEPQPVPAVQYCGACSEPKCQGVVRGSACSLGGGQGWGHCNIYSGGNWCPTGNWECQCGTGPLP